MNASVLEKVRKFALWATIIAFAGLVIMMLLETWEAIDTSTTGVEDEWGYAESKPNALGKLQESLGAIAAISFATLLSMLVATNVKKSED